MKKWLISIVIVLCVSGCGSPVADIGIGTGIGAALSGTISRAKADLERREQELIKLYNQGVEQGMVKESLDQIEQDIIDTRLARQTVDAGGGLLDVDWTDPQDVGGTVAVGMTLLLAWLNRKERKKVAGRDAAINKFCGTSEPATAAKLHDMVKAKTNGVG